jgi:hypothetical protein
MTKVAGYFRSSGGTAQWELSVYRNVSDIAINSGAYGSIAGNLN